MKGKKMKEVDYSEQKVLFIPEAELNLPEGWKIVSAKSVGRYLKFNTETMKTDVTYGIDVTVRKVAESESYPVSRLKN